MAIYTEYMVNKIVDALVKKYATMYKKHGSNLDKLETIQRNIENELVSVIKSENLNYTKECIEIDNLYRLIECRFDYYFKVGNFYNWLNGNDNFKKLI